MARKYARRRVPVTREPRTVYYRSHTIRRHDGFHTVERPAESGLKQEASAACSDLEEAKRIVDGWMDHA